MTITEQKKNLRLEIKERLRTLQYSYTETSLNVYKNLRAFLDFDQINVIATYIDFNNELPTLPFLPQLFQRTPHSLTSSPIIAVPFCEKNNMSFCRLRPPQLNVNQQMFFSDLKPGKYGILEPLKEIRNYPQNIVLPNSIDIMLTPGLAFDFLGRRLGRGAGYYDRYLATTSATMLIIALAFDCQIVDKVPSEQFDISVDVVVTPTRIFPISSKFKSSKFVYNFHNKL